jgi:hypothetical protein
MSHPLRGVQELAETKVMHEFAQKFQFAYLGHVDARTDEYEVVRGLTLSATHEDHHFIVGTYNSYDVTTLQREVELNHPAHGKRIYKWTILQVDLIYKKTPNIVMTSGHQDIVFVEDLRIKLPTHQLLDRKFFDISPQFNQRFRVLSPIEGIDEAVTILRPEAIAIIMDQFKQFDIELLEDKVIVYSWHPFATLNLLQEMLREGLWFADYLDGIAKSIQNTTTEAEHPSWYKAY